MLDHFTARTRRSWIRWTGWILTGLPCGLMLLSASLKLRHEPGLVAQVTGKFGFSESALTGLAALEIACVLLYAIPRTALVGAILLTGYLGGAIATHVRVADHGFVVPLLLGLFVWAGLYLRQGTPQALLSPSWQSATR
ncbi:MAG: DoxX family protein [Acidobacteriota bacterium]